MRPARIASLMFAAALTPLVGAPAADATFPGADGRIAFTQEAPAGDHTQSDVYTVNADGSGLQRLSASANQNEFGPAFNAAGTRIAFWRTPAPFGPGSLWVMNADGSGKRQLTTGIDARDPAWDPSGTRLAYTGPGAGSFDIWTLRAADGQDRRRVTSGAATDFEPAWSPDGARIAFTRGLAQGDAGNLYAVGAGGGTANQITSTPAYDHQASWGPGGQRLTYERDFANSSSILVVGADRLEPNAAHDRAVLRHRPRFLTPGEPDRLRHRSRRRALPRPLGDALRRCERPQGHSARLRQRLSGLAAGRQLRRQAGQRTQRRPRSIP